MQLTVQVEREADGRWIAAVDPIGALAYGRTRAEAVRKAKAVALDPFPSRCMTERRSAPRMLAQIAKRTGLTREDL
jgi:predicted RNase H-like HicB family nuclease